jgi:hypothetical protein
MLSVGMIIVIKRIQISALAVEDSEKRCAIEITANN